MEAVTEITQSISVADGYPSDKLDLTSALEAVQDLADQVELPRLLDKLMRAMIESAIAHRGCLLLPTQDGWEVAATGVATQAEVELPSAIGVEASLPVTVIDHVACTCEPLVLEGAVSANGFAGDPYLLSAQPKSLVCLPMLYRRELVGIIYLENLITADGFPRDRLGLLRLLAMQAAVCLQNNSLVDDLKQAQKSAWANEQRFHRLFDNAPLCVFEVGLDSGSLVILAANRRAEALYGWSVEEFAAMSLEMLFPRGRHPEIRGLAKCVRAGETVTIETTSRHRDGSDFPARVIATPEVEIGSGADCMFVAVRNISAEKQQRSEAQVVDEERRRIAQEIHDGVVQDLAAMRLRTSVWDDLLGAGPAQMHAELDELRAVLDRGIAEMRRAIFALRPVALDEVGLFPALRQSAADFENQYQFYVDLRISGREQHMPSKLELPVFRVVQEALHNVGKHAQASLIWLAIDMTQDQVITLTIRDNGRGFDPASLDGMVRGGHLGLKQMRERVEKARGALEIHSQPGQGTELRAVFPVES